MLQKPYILFFLFIGVMAAFAQTVPVTTVGKVELSRYIGVWHEVARIPNSFQRQCIGNTTATYAILDDGRISVINQCQKEDGSMSRIEGVAKVVDPESNAKLKVSFVSLFGIRLFWGDYWIIGLDAQYHYAVVGHPNRKYGWILCRVPQLTSDEKETVKKILVDKGYDPAKFQWGE